MPDCPLTGVEIRTLVSEVAVRLGSEGVRHVLIMVGVLLVAAMRDVFVMKMCRAHPNDCGEQPSTRAPGQDGTASVC